MSRAKAQGHWPLCAAASVARGELLLLAAERRGDDVDAPFTGRAWLSGVSASAQTSRCAPRAQAGIWARRCSSGR